METNNRASKARSIIDQFKKCDKVIEEQRRSVRKIRNLIIFLNVTLTVIALTICVVDIVHPGLIIHYILSFIVAFALLGSVLHMRMTIKRTNFILPNDDLVWVHIILFTIWFIAQIA